MKSNTLLTYLLYALLATLILSAGYKMCQMQKDKERKAKEEAEWQETLKKLYPEGDTTASGSSYSDYDSTRQTTATSPPPSSNSGTPPPASTGAATKPTTPQSTTSPSTTTPSTTTTIPKTTTKGGGTSVPGVGSGQWEVRAGTFQYMDGARERLEQVIRMGYTNAEIKKTSNGWAAVVVLRTNDKNRAIQTVDQLERRGVDAAVFKR
ncbi:MAG: hypothetical protein KIS77_12725 [Saprospiraceae bacterium]|nr:hypothetical protein [Saprospiraceae bacterium]